MDWDDPPDALRKVINKFQKTHPGLWLNTYSMPSCCSALVLSGAITRNQKKEEMVTFVQDLIKAGTETYSFLISTLLIPSQSEWIAVLKEAGFEESSEVARSNHYNGATPLRVYIKSLRPMTEEEVKTKMAEFEIDVQKKKKAGYA